MDFIQIVNARENNLKNVTLDIPRNKLVVVTGLSGSGKSSLIFNTLFAEAQRRYIETFSSYARQFMGEMKRPDVEKIDGLSPVISIEQKTIGRNPRSTVGTISEIYDFLRLLYSKVSTAYSYNTGEMMIQYSESQMLELIYTQYKDVQISIMAPLIRARKGNYIELFKEWLKKGFTKVCVNGKIFRIDSNIKIDRFKTHDIDLIVDTLKIDSENEDRIKKAFEIAYKVGNGSISILINESGKVETFSKNYICNKTGISYENPSPNTFSFNSKYGYCHDCKGLGYMEELDLETIFPFPNKDIFSQENDISQKFLKNNILNQNFLLITKKYNFSPFTKIKDFSKEILNIIIEGEYSSFKLNLKNAGISRTVNINFDGVRKIILEKSLDKEDIPNNKYEEYTLEKKCSSCDGSRLKKEALWFKIDKKNISEVCNMELDDFKNWYSKIYNYIDNKKHFIIKEINNEILKRVSLLIDVGLNYLTLSREIATLSGGEAQRIRLASQIGSQLVNILYVLDEPSIGLHQRDNIKLINTLKKLKDAGNSVIVVEHDQEIMENSDFIIDIGPGAGVKGGEVIYAGKYNDLIKKGKSLTLDFLLGSVKIDIPKIRKNKKNKDLTIYGASGNNLKNIDVKFPLGSLICVTGVSGSGKSTLISETLFPILNKYVYNGVKNPLPYKKVEGLENIDKVIIVDQSPIGRTPRSNPATYIGIFTDIRKLFAELPESKIRGYKLGRFSFNLIGGRCEKCRGGGIEQIKMGFLPDVEVVCNECNGLRYNRETLHIKYKGKTINDILNLNFEDAVHFFENLPSIRDKIQMVVNVGLGYLKLGQSSTTISGGEAQRVKLSTELTKKSTGKTFYILDEPTTGLHFQDIKVLMDVLNQLVEKGNTVLIIEHNMDVIKLADHIIEIGPEAGKNGGKIVAEGTPEFISNSKCATAEFLKKALGNK